MDAQAVRSKFEARFQFFVIAAAQYAAPALTVLLSLALCLHVSSGGSDPLASNSGVTPTPSFSPPLSRATLAGGLELGGGGAGVGERGLGICNAARWVAGAQPWEAAATAAIAVAAEAEAESGAVEVAIGGDRSVSRKTSGQSGRGRPMEAERGGTEAGGGGGGGGGTVTGDGDVEGGGGGGAGGARGLERGGGGLADVVERIPGLPEAFLAELAGFFAWWACVSWAVTYAMGVVFWRCFPEDVRVEQKEKMDRTTKGKKGKGEGRGKGKGKAKGRGPGKGGGGSAAGVSREGGSGAGAGTELAGGKGNGGPSPAS